MGPRSGSSNGQWQTVQPQRRSNDSNSSAPSIPNETLPPQEMARISARLAEIERIVQANASRRPVAGNQSSISAGPNLLPNARQAGASIHALPPQPSQFAVPPPAVPPPNPTPTFHYLPPLSPIPAPPAPSTRPANIPVPFVPPPPYMDDIFRDFSLSPPQEYLAHEARLYQRINFQAKVKLGYGKTIAVLQRELEGAPEYERIIRPYQIDQPDNLPLLSPLIPNSEARLFADTVRALVDIIGLQRSCHLLENAKIEEVPGIRYEIQRVIIPSSPVPIHLEQENVTMTPIIPDVGPFARARPGSSASSSTFSTAGPAVFSWSDGPGALSPPPPPAPPTSIIDRELTNSPESEDAPLQPTSPTPTPPRSILRRNSSGNSYNGKRVTIQTELDYCPPFYENNSANGFDTVLTPMSMSPIEMEDRKSRQMEGSTEFQQHPIQNRTNSIKAEDGVLQQMAAAQM